MPAFHSINVGIRSERGKRQRNEDFCLYDEEKRLVVLSDGVGGAPYGDAMARICCYGTMDLWDDDASSPLERHLESLVSNLSTITARISRWLGDEGSSATLLVCAFEGMRAGVASVGDCKAFLIHEGSCSSFAADARLAEDSHTITQAMGIDQLTHAAIWCPEVVEGDCLVLCTDGAWEALTEEQLVALCSDSTLDEASIAYRICEASDGSDNATAVVIRLHAEPSEVASPLDH